MGIRAKKTKIKYDLTSPCNDCPFKRTSKKHKGVPRNFPTAHSAMERGDFVHSCHKTDPDSDGFVSFFKGGVQHCAGALIMLEKEGNRQYPAEGRVCAKKLDVGNTDVFSSFVEMIKHYDTEIRELLLHE